MTATATLPEIDVASNLRASSRASVEVAELSPRFASEHSDLHDEWTSLFETPIDANYAQLPDYALHESASLQNDRGNSGLLLRLKSDDESPSMAILQPKSIRLGRSAAAFAPRGWHGYRLAGGHWLGANSETSRRQLLDAVLAELARRAADFLLIEDLETNSPLWHEMQHSVPRGFVLHLPANVQPRLKIQLPETFDQFFASFTSKMRTNMRRRQKTFGEARLMRVTEPDQVDEFVRLAGEVSQQTWQTRRIGLRVNADDAAQTESLRILARHGLLRSYALLRGDQPVAFSIGNQLNGYFNFEETGYDSALADLAPGIVLVLRVIEDLCTHDNARWFDFGGGTAEYKRHFANVTSESGSVWLVRPTLRNRALLTALAANNALGQLGRKTLARLGWLSNIKRLWRRGLA